MAQTMVLPAPARPHYAHPAWALGARLLLGGTLVYSSLHKIGQAADLARIAYGYRLLHPELVNLFAFTLPWLELLTGALLLVGLLRHSAALTAMLIMAGFTLATAMAMARGIETPCGCFSLAWTGERVGLEVIVRDTALALVAAYLVWYPYRPAELDRLWDREARLPS